MGAGESIFTRRPELHASPFGWFIALLHFAAQRMLLIEFFTVSCFVFMMLLTAV